MTLYVLVPTAVYDQGVVGVYESEELAREAATSIWHDTDGHHAFRIDPVEINTTYPDVFDHYFDSGWNDGTKWRRVSPDSLPKVFLKGSDEDLDG